MADYDFITYESLSAGRVVRIMMNRPDARNAQNRGLLVELDDAFMRAERDDDVRVVILGQDPYPTPGHAHGLAFSADPDVHPLPRSLNNIYKEMIEDIGAAPSSADLRPWARQGVLLLNTVLSVPAGEANGHKKLGWQTLAQEVLAEVSKRPCAFLLWGAQAHKMEERLTPGGHFILKTAHPSPLSARKGFFGSKPFSKVNTWLESRGKSPIIWA